MPSKNEENTKLENVILNEAKKLDSHGLLNQQIKLMQTQMKRI